MSTRQSYRDTTGRYLAGDVYSHIDHRLSTFGDGVGIFTMYDNRRAGLLLWFAYAISPPAPRRFLWWTIAPKKVAGQTVYEHRGEWYGTKERALEAAVQAYLCGAQPQDESLREQVQVEIAVQELLRGAPTLPPEHGI